MSRKKTHKMTLEGLHAKATELLHNAAALMKLLDDLKVKVGANSHVFKTVQGELHTVQRLLKAWMDGRYISLPWKTLVIMVGAALYIVNPLDLFPDFLLGGLLDDLSLLTYVLARIKGDLDEFRAWEGKQESPSK